MKTLRVDLVGSFLRPPELKDAMAGHLQGTASAEALAEVQDRAIRDLLAEEERHGLPVVTDGEFRRLNFEHSFKDSVTGVDAWTETYKRGFFAKREDSEGVHEATDPATSTNWILAPAERLTLKRNLPLEEYRFAVANSSRPVKVTLLGADRLAQTFNPLADQPVYASLDDFLADVVAVERQIVSELVGAGCPYVQIDAPSYTSYVDDSNLAAMKAHGDDPAVNLERSIRADNAILEGLRPSVFGIHLCRGNRQSMWHRQGAYDAIAEQAFSTLRHDRFLLEYDSDRAGGFEPLRFIPEGKIAVLGLITTKTGALESAAAIKARIDEAARYLPLDQLALSPQCGFASSVPGNLLGQDEQWRKIDLMLEIARDIWG